MSASTMFPLAKALDTILEPEIEAIQVGEPCTLLEQTTEVTQRLLQWWFRDDYCETRTFNFHPGQRQAILAIIYSHEVLKSDSLLNLYEELAPSSLLEGGLLGRLTEGNQHPKYAAKMATGTGKTWVLNALLVWQYLNKIATPEDPRFTKNFLIVTPGLIVYDRLLDSFMGKEHDKIRDFHTSDIFAYQELFVPPDQHESVFGFIQSSVVTKADIGTKITGGGQIAITNWHLLAGKDSDDPDFADLEDEIEIPGQDIDEKAAVESIFPITPGTASGNSLDVLDRRFARGRALESLIDLPDLMVFNDEAHHVHTIKRGGEVTEVEWQKSLNAIAGPKGSRFVQVDFSATPYNERGSGKNARKEYFSHIIVDFDLNQAMSTGLVKSLALDRRKEVASLELDFRAERDDKNNVLGLSEGQRVMINAGLTKLRKLEESFEEFDETKHPKLLIMCEDTNVTPYVVEYLHQTGLAEDDVIRVDSGRKAELSKKDWETARERLFDVDKHKQPKVIVSVLMLREGFDVNNICVIVPLRASGASILLEQTIGRGLRLMWRGDPEIDEQKEDTRNRIRKGQEPTNSFDVLFIVEHPAFIEFYEDLLKGGLAVEVGDEGDGANPTGDIQSIELRDGYEEFDFSIPFILREVDEEMEDPIIDPLSLPPSKFPLHMLKNWVGKGDTFVSQDVQTGTQYGDYRVDGGIMTATGYNDYLSRMVNRIAASLGSNVTRSAKAHKQASEYPALQMNLPQLTGWLDDYIKNRLFGERFQPWLDEQWRVLLIDDIAHHIATTFASAITEHEGNHVVGEADVRYRNISEVEMLPVNMTTAEQVNKCVYPYLPVSRQFGGLERKFMQWSDTDASVEAFVKIHEHRHDFLRHRYLKEDGMPGTYSPDFLVRTKDCIYIVETKAQRDLSSINVQRKAKSARNWCNRINELEPTQRSDREWFYVLLGEQHFDAFKSQGSGMKQLLEFAKLTGSELVQERLI